MFFLNVVFVTVLSLLAATTMVSASSNDVPIPQEVARQLTNARRLARGYPLRAPRRRHDHHDHWHRGTHTHEHRAAPSAGPGPSPVQGCLELIKMSDDMSLGYISKNYNSDGSIGLTGDKTQCLCFDLSGQLLMTINGPDVDKPFVGLLRQGADGLYNLGSLVYSEITAALGKDKKHVEFYQDKARYSACSRNNVLLVGDNCPLDDIVQINLV